MMTELTMERQVAELELELPTLDNGMLTILHGDALEYFDPPEIVAAYEREIDKRIAAGSYTLD